MHVPGLAIKLFQSEFANGTRESRRLTTHKIPVDPQKFSSPSKEPKGDFLQHETHKTQSQLPVLATSQPNPSTQCCGHESTNTQASPQEQGTCTYLYRLGSSKTHVCKLTLFLTFPKTKYYTSALVETNCAPIKDFFFSNSSQRKITNGRQLRKPSCSQPSILLGCSPQAMKKGLARVRNT